ncbi:MAG: 4Fe-4S cluster-binding domain-containing protein [Candidatus Pacearchaeota archaeon]
MKPELNLMYLKQKLNKGETLEFFKYCRSKYLSKRKLAGSLNKNNLFEKVLEEIGSVLKIKPEELWGSQTFQLLFRATKPEDLEILGIDKKSVEESKKSVDSGRAMSLLPYNSIMSETTIRKFIPSRSEKFSGNWRHSMDPYGVFEIEGRILAKDKERKEIYLATRKFPYAVLVNITESCPIGCDGCYKGSMVRTSLVALANVYPEYAEIKKQLTLEQKRAVQQIRLLTKWLNQNQEVDTIVFSGGEPTLFDNDAIKKILDELKKAKYVKVVRMCTSAIFQGLWYRIDDKLVKIFADFEKETGKQFYINAHVTDEYQLSAPEAKIAIDKLNTNGITIHLQMPLQEGINFKRSNLAWSVEKLRKISKQAYVVGVIPYKLIIDMHSSSHPDLTVPIEMVTKAISFLDSHTENSDMERWQAYNILHEQGNLYLASYPHFSAVKEIDKENRRVIYFIPKIEFGDKKKIIIHTYEEPLIENCNDNPNSLNIIADKDILGKINEVKRYYLLLKNKIRELEKSNLTFEEKAKEIGKIEREFYKNSGVIFPDNKSVHLCEDY